MYELNEHMAFFVRTCDTEKEFTTVRLYYRYVMDIIRLFFVYVSFLSFCKCKPAIEYICYVSWTLSTVLTNLL